MFTCLQNEEVINIYSEKSIEKHLRESIEELGGYCFKWTSPGNRGVPDRLVFLPRGKFFLIELKTEIGRRTKLQLRMIEKLRSLGFDARVVKGMNGVDSFLKEVKDEIQSA